MKFFDALMFLDVEWGGEPHRFSDLASLEKVMDKYGIARAIVSAGVDRRPGIEYINEGIFEATAGNDRIVPAPVVVPNSGLEVGDEDAFVEDLVLRRARVVCFYPKTLGTSLDPRIVDGLFTAIEKRRIPVALFETSWLESADIANRFPDIPFILHRPDYRNRQYLPLLKSTPNLYVSLAPNFAPYRGIETIVRECGAERILYGSDAPWMPFGHQLGRVLFADIPEKAKKKILIENPKRVLSARAG